jgi:hypothetical protein
MMNEALRRGFIVGMKVARFDMLKSLVDFRVTLDTIEMASQRKRQLEVVGGHRDISVPRVTEAV